MESVVNRCEETVHARTVGITELGADRVVATMHKLIDRLWKGSPLGFYRKRIGKQLRTPANGIFTVETAATK